jgi:hypothetical protein
MALAYAEGVEGTEEDPNARLDYEWLRTRDSNTN